MTKPIEAKDFSGAWDPRAQVVRDRPDFDRMRRAALLTPEDPGYNPNAATLAEIDQMQQQWEQQQNNRP